MAKHKSDATKAATTEKKPGKLGYKLIASISAAVGANLARKVLTQGWKTATGKEPPTKPEHPAVSVGEAAGWAALSAGGVAVARVLAQRKVAATWRRASGEMPPGMAADEKAKK
jgi:hypothetical protein